MTRLASAFAKGRPALVTFVTGGDPTPDATASILDALVGGGADVIELGMPFTDPMADGPAIQLANLRSLGAGLAGVELVFFLLILAGRVMGPAFGFVLGVTSLFASALLTSGVGPWLPYQMMCSAWIGLGAGLLPRRTGSRAWRGRREIAMLVVYGVVCAYGFGLLMNLSSWPYAVGIAVPGHEGSLSYVAGAPVWDNLRTFGVYTLLTSTGSWDTGRAVTNSLALVLLGPAILGTLRRAARRSAVVAPRGAQPSTVA